MIETSSRGAAALFLPAEQAAASVFDGFRCRRRVGSKSAEGKALRFLLVQFVFAAAVLAQPVSLAGPWKMQTGDNPQWSQPQFDDRNWPVVTLPMRAFEAGIFWLRRTVPAPACAGECYVTIGLISEGYELYANGVRIGGAGDFASSELHYPQPRAFGIPTGVSNRGSTLTLALRVRGSHMMWGRTGQGLSDRNSYWLSDAAYASAAVEAARNQVRLEISPYLASLCVQGGIGLCLLLLWLGDRERFDLLFFAGYLLGECMVDCIGIFVVTGGRSSLWTFLIYRPCNLAAVSLLAAALRIIFRLPSFPIWAIGAAALSSLVLDIWYSHTILFLAPWYAVLAWLCAGAIRSSLRANILIVAPCAFYIAAGLNNLLPAPHLFPLAFAPGGLTLSFTSLAQSLLGTSMLVLVLRRLNEDRREKLRLNSELEAARAVQQLLLPATAHAWPGYRTGAAYLPAQEVGGDFYQFLECADGSRLAILGDVSGKGLKAAMLVSVAFGVLRRETESSPAAILAGLNRALLGHTGGGFVTCCCVRFDADGRLAVASAGHPAAYLQGVEIPKEAGLPLGVSADADYVEVNGLLADGEQLTIVSDGVVEASNEKGELFGFDRTREVSSKYAHEVAAAAQAWGQNDDITVVTVRRFA